MLNLKLRKSLQILNEKTYEFDIQQRDVIERLRQQQGSCHLSGCRLGLRTLELAFTCDKNGFFKIYEDFPTIRNKKLFRAYFVCGEVLEENGKTKVKVYTVRDRASVICKNIIPFLHLPVIGAWIALPFILNIPFLFPLIFILLDIDQFVLDTINIKKEFSQKDQDIKSMHEAVNKRIEAIKRWNQ